MISFWFGVLLVLVAWLGLRRAIGTRLLSGAFVATLLDLAIALAGFAGFLLLFARPILAALVIIALAGGLGVVDHVKKHILREPVVFADRAELLELVRHPALYLPFAGTWQVLAGVAVALAAVAGLLVIEPPILPWTPANLLLGPGLIVACLVVPVWPPLLRCLQLLYETFHPSRDPEADAKRFGVLATFVIHATIARAERPARRIALRPRPSPTCLAADTILLVQSESFFDIDRLRPGLGADIQPHWQDLRAQSWQHGALDVPCWGANTIRSEFAVLAGVDQAALGLDRFNPYAALARTPIDSMIWRAREAGYRTICVHPFDLAFYGRRHVLPQLGFDVLVGAAAFRTAERAGRYVSDLPLAHKIAELLADDPGKLMVFAITMACHGPWEGSGRPDESIALPPALADGPEASALAQFLFRLRQSDAALPVLQDALRRRPGLSAMALYGDHQPGLPLAFAHAGLVDPRTDYLLWRSDGRRGPRRDLAAGALGRALLEAAT